jgi:gamma-glutamyl:cysteine ligase YbdK (ATP-grasp superfamily)
VPSITGNLIPEYVDSFEEYEKTTVRRYSEDLAKLNAPRSLLDKEWLNSRGAIIRQDRKAIEIRVLDEQESVKSDVALSCFIRAVLRGILGDADYLYLAYPTLVQNFSRVLRKGLQATVQHPNGKTAGEVCLHLLKTALSNATDEERKYLPIIKQRIDGGNLSNIILKRVAKKAQRTDLHEAIFTTYSHLADCLEKNQVCVN